MCVCGSGRGNFSSLSVFVSNLNGLGSYLYLTVSDDSSDGTVVSDGWSSMYLFMYSSWSGNNVGSYDASISYSWCSSKMGMSS